MIPSSLSSSSSSSSATVRVDKATSDLLIGPDWTMNIDICDSINTNQWDAKDVVKAVKKRLQHKNPKVQLLALTLLETMVKNCGDHVHFQIVERNILQEMIKIVKKKTDMHVRDKTLVLLDSWQEAFGGPRGKYPQYYRAYEELRRAGVVFPQRSLDSAPIFTPPVARSTLRHTQAGYGMPSNSSARLDEAMGVEMENLSLSTITSMRDVLDLLADMLKAVNPSDRASVKDEVIVDLVNRCRSNQKKLMQLLSSTGDEELLGQGLELNDSLQSVLAKHDAIASGSPLPTQGTDINPRSVAAHDSSIKPTEVKERSQTPNANPSAPAVTSVRAQIEEEEDQEDDFAQLARRHFKTHSITSRGTSTGHSGGVTSANTSSGSVTSVNASTNAMSPTQPSVAPVPSNALALVDPPAPVRTTKEQDMIDLLSLTLSTVTVSPQTPRTPAASSQNIHQPPVSLTSQGYPYASQAYSGNQGQVPFNSYVVPWAQPQVQPQPQPQSPSYLQPQPQLQPQSHSQPYFPPQPQPHLQSQPQSQTQPQSQLQPQYHSQPYFQPQPQAQLQHQPQSQSNLQPQSHSQRYFQPQAQLQPQPQSQNQPQPQPQAQLQHQLESRPQPQPQSHPQLQHQHESQSQPQPQPQPQPQHQPQYQSQQRTQAQPQYLQYSSGYPPPPWAPTPGYLSNRNHLSTTSNMFSIPRANAPASHTSMHGARPLHNVNSFTARGGNMSPMNGEQRLSSSPRATASAAGQKPFVPSYRLFEDLNVFGKGDGKFKMSSSTSPSLSGTSSPSMVGGRK